MSTELDGIRSRLDAVAAEALVQRIAIAALLAQFPRRAELIPAIQATIEVQRVDLLASRASDEKIRYFEIAAENLLVKLASGQ
ncbi:MAG: hypothetical protein H7255_14590 [Ramlibacter sp.]|nr:hypothetical protein [Ramlibacter sp.]